MSAVISLPPIFADDVELGGSSFRGFPIISSSPVLTHVRSPPAPSRSSLPVLPSGVEFDSVPPSSPALSEGFESISEDPAIAPPQVVVGDEQSKFAARPSLGDKRMTTSGNTTPFGAGGFNVGKPGRSIIDDLQVSPTEKRGQTRERPFALRRTRTG